MTIPLKPFATLVADAAAAAQSVALNALGFETGSVELAIVNAYATIAVWLEYIAITILAATRLATSSGTDVDTFISDYGMSRLAGVAATGNVTFTSFTPSQSSATIPVGTIVKTVAGIEYTVTEDSTNSAWSVADTAYVRPEGTATVVLPVQATVAGSSGNAAVGAISLLGSAVSGVDTVTNTAALTNGADSETDAEVKTRFPLWLASKATACEAAVEEAIAETSNGLTQEIVDCALPDGTVQQGFFTVVVDDGSGDPSDALLAKVYEAIDTVKALGVGFAVQRPVDQILNIAMTVLVPSGTDQSTVATNISTAISADISSRAVGAGYPISRLAIIANNAAGVTISGIYDATINGSAADIPAADKTVVRPGTVTVTMGIG